MKAQHAKMREEFKERKEMIQELQAAGAERSAAQSLPRRCEECRYLLTQLFWMQVAGVAWRPGRAAPALRGARGRGGAGAAREAPGGAQGAERNDPRAAGASGGRVRVRPLSLEARGAERSAAQWNEWREEWKELPSFDERVRTCVEAQHAKMTAELTERRALIGEIRTRGEEKSAAQWTEWRDGKSEKEWARWLATAGSASCERPPGASPRPGLGTACL